MRNTAFASKAINRLSSIYVHCGQTQWHPRQLPYLPDKRRSALRSGQAKNSGRISSILAWAGICCVLSAGLWAVTLYKLKSEKEEITQAALKDATYLSQSYAEQLSRSIEQLDHIAIHLQYEWKNSGGTLQLSREANPGVSPLVSNLRVWMTDSDGAVVSSTDGRQTAQNVSSKDYFQVHASTPGNRFYIGRPDKGYQEENAEVHFSRKLVTAGGAFGGVIVLAASPEYLESFTSELALGDDDSVTLKTVDGTLLASKRGRHIRQMPTIYRTPSVFESDKGVVQMAAESFVDDKARIVAWHKLKSYPLVSIVNRTEDDIFADYRQMARDYQAYAALGTLMLLLFSIVGITLTDRLAKKRKQANDIRFTYRLATEAAQEGFFTVKALYNKSQLIEDFAIEDCNDRGARFLGFNRESLVGIRFSSLYSNQRAQQVLSVFRAAMESGFHEDELRLPVRGEERPLWINRRLVKFENGLAVTLRDISQAKFHEQELAKLANTDSLTGLPNRHWMRQYLPQALEQAKKNHSVLAVLFLDLDDFKNINDTLGHDTGDELLKAVALRIRSQLRPGDNVVRLGGDEFTVISEGYDGSANVAPLAERIIHALAEPFPLNGGHLHKVAASIGISIYREDGLDPDTLLKHADIAMYAAKTGGKARYQFYQPHMTERLIERLDNEKALRSAIDVDEFSLFYQPKVSTETGEVVGLEALVRWNHPVRGMVSPAEFIPFAEQTGLIEELGTLVLDKACQQMAAWKAMGLTVVPVSVNVSAGQLEQRGFLEHLKKSLHCTQVDVSLLHLELTESSTISENRMVKQQLEEIKDLGIRLAIDDFGTGYSSMSQLQRLDMDVLKIDQSFTRALTVGPEGEVFFMAMISMAHVLGMCVVAEGVENLQQLRILRDLSCDEIQGYFVSKPVAAAEVPAMLKKRFLFPQETADFAEK